MPIGNKFSILFNYANESILVANSSGKIILANPACEKLFGYSKNELLKQLVEILIPDRFITQHQQERNNYYNNHSKARIMGAGLNLHGKRKDGSTFPLEISLSPFKSNGRRFVMAFIVDISARKKNETILKQQHDKLQQLTDDFENRVKERTEILEKALLELETSRKDLSEALEKEKELHELKTRFVSMASHEFRTPLATILSSLSLVQKYGAYGDTENQSRHFNRIKSSVNHLLDILNDMLSLSKLDEGMEILNPEEIELPDFIDQVIQELQPVAKKNQLMQHFHNGLTHVTIDAKVIKNILFNLISNAIKFSDEEKEIQVYSSINKREIIIKVKDHGIGIPEKDRHHLFERFYRAENVTHIQGTGLGLNIVAKYVEMLNGNISFESKRNKGTTFVIRLPK
jgi:PAS domain S-box-containing protein